MSETGYTLDDLLYLMARLRDPQTGCPWDIKQDYASIAPSTIEEAYEVVDAIEKQDFGHLNEELGDLLFQVIFYAQIGKEEQRFDFSSIVSSLVEKLVRRHPHVFPEGTLQSQVSDRHNLPDDIKQRWEIIKQQERASKGAHGVLDDVPVNFPALSRAAKLQKRAANVGFDWENIHGPLAKVREELIEVEEALEQNDSEHLSEELGDLLFAVVNVVRYLKEDPEAVLRSANRKFEKRFQYIEQQLGDQLKAADIDTMNRLWDEAKTLKIS
ncbi:nucleoside triphosphate pyrophosphohydrolase [Cellvibrio polysaccharolyticus]|uniref:Nucleoside triphosphate pyrophosphohydrolase n=1 Tax=Cellvibrio polysaccharolyticus TaxID=2082724 RepID=A0A928V4A1_9GAMM|nr:nucleoside triphosphate pyrophosphohydrolase [Cellvibrio polysaccharolyticus]MBE8718012.1 nucleoside triphosphate pyrophosphohydrolase [Cellvibrio polysaccharolyticus]